MLITVKKFLLDIIECEKLKNFTTPISNAICLNFVFDKIFFDENFSSVYLWLNFNIKDVWTNSKRKSNRLISTSINITNTKQNSLIEYNNVKNGWNTIDITELIMKMMNENEKRDIIVLKCNKECLIEIDNNTSYRTNALPTLYLNKQQYPLLQLNNGDKKSSSKHLNIKRDNHHHVNIRSKRDERLNKIGDDNSENEAISNHIESESPNLCKNNIGHPNQECCLVSHYVSFSALKWSNWVIAPAGYRANFCIGRCSSARGNK
jgi:predicted DNA-binding protein (MmcQ/YjbR family)